MKHKKTENTTAIQIASEIPFTTEQDHLFRLATDAHRSLTNAGEKWRIMVRYVREQMLGNKLAFPQIKAALLKAGWNPQRASEINTIASNSDDAWREYDEGKIGFRPALEKARATNETTPGKRGRKSGKNAFLTIVQAHAKASRRNPKVHGIHYANGSFVAASPLSEGEFNFTLNGSQEVSYTISIAVTKTVSKTSMAAKE